MESELLDKRVIIQYEWRKTSYNYVRCARGEQ